MADETPVPETLQTIAEQISALSKSIDQRFDAVDKRFDAVDKRFDAIEQRFDRRFNEVDQRFEKIERRITTETAETRSQLGVKIEAVHAEVKLVYDDVIAQRDKHKTNDKDHQEFRKRLDAHDLQFLARTSREKNDG